VIPYQKPPCSIFQVLNYEKSGSAENFFSFGHFFNPVTWVLHCEGCIFYTGISFLPIGSEQTVRSFFYHRYVLYQSAQCNYGIYATSLVLERADDERPVKRFCPAGYQQQKGERV
jgi:hypothetical protein